MKKSLVLEYRVRKLEKLFLEDIDDDLERDAEAILQKDPYVDLDKELNNSANRIIGKQNKVEFETVNDWIDSMVFNTSVGFKDKIKGLQYAIDKLNRMINDQTSARLKEGDLNFGLYRAGEIRDCIDELQNKNVLIANQIMVSALRKRVKELKKELDAEKKATNINKYGDKYPYSTIEDWFDDLVFVTDLNIDHEASYNGDVLKKLQRYLKSFSMSFLGAPWIDNVNLMKNKIKEISDMNVVSAQHKLCKAIKSRIDLVKKR